MRLFSIGIATLTAVLCMTTPLPAQATGQRGIVLGYPGGIGLLWQTSDALALRADMGFSKSILNGGSESWAGGVGISSLYRLSDAQERITYVAPRAGYSRNVLQSSGSETTTYSLSAAIGSRQMITKAFAVFGEAGLIATYQTASQTFQGVELPGSIVRRFGTTAGIGVLVLF